MPFDPTMPQQNTEVDAPQMRAQLNALHDLILALTTRADGLDATVATQAAQIAALWVALANTAQNPAISQMTFGLSDPPLQAQLQGIYDQLNTLTNLLVRV